MPRSEFSCCRNHCHMISVVSFVHLSPFSLVCICLLFDLLRLGDGGDILGRVRGPEHHVAGAHAAAGGRRQDRRRRDQQQQPGGGLRQRGRGGGGPRRGGHWGLQRRRGRRHQHQRHSRQQAPETADAPPQAVLLVDVVVIVLPGSHPADALHVLYYNNRCYCDCCSECPSLRFTCSFSLSLCPSPPLGQPLPAVGRLPRVAALPQGGLQVQLGRCRHRVLGVQVRPRRGAHSQARVARRDRAAHPTTATTTFRAGRLTYYYTLLSTDFGVRAKNHLSVCQIFAIGLLY